MNTMVKLLAAAFGALVSAVTGMPPVVWVLIGVMTLDFVTGLVLAAAGRSPKSPSGALSSNAAFQGLMRKCMVLLVVLLAALLDAAVASGAQAPFSAVTGATCLWFIASEGLSILENAAQLDLPLPPALKKALEVMKKE